HYLLIREIIRALPGAVEDVQTLVDLGCGTGASSAAWASSCERAPIIIAIDRHPWAVAEAVKTYQTFGLSARVRRGDIARVVRSKTSASFLGSFTLNELSDATRDAVLGRVIQHVGRRKHPAGHVLIVEPLAGFVAPWWDRWSDRVVAAGGRADHWRFRVELPAIVSKLDRAAGLDHRELSARSLWIARQLPMSLAAGR